MSVIIRLQNLPWSANALDIRAFFRGLSILDGGVNIVGGEMGDAFIAFSTDEDARQAMNMNGGKIKEVGVRLSLSSRAEMQKVIEDARQPSSAILQQPQQQSIETTTPPAIVPIVTTTVVSAPIVNTPAVVTPAAAAAGGAITSPLSSLLTQQVLEQQLEQQLLEQKKQLLQQQMAAKQGHQYGADLAGKSLYGANLTQQLTLQQQQQLLQQQLLAQQQRLQVQERHQQAQQQQQMQPLFQTQVKQREDPRRALEREDRAHSSSERNDRRGRRSRSRSRERRRSRSRDRNRRRRDRSRSRERRRRRDRRTRSRERSFERERLNKESDKNRGRHDSKDDNKPAFTTPQIWDIPPIIQGSGGIMANQQHLLPVQDSATLGHNSNLPEKLFSQRDTDNRDSWTSREGRCIRISGMDPITGYGEIRRFFYGLMINSNGIKMINDSNGKRKGEAVVEFVRQDSQKIAVQRGGLTLKGRIVRVSAITEEEFDNEIDSYRPSRGRDRDYHHDHRDDDDLSQERMADHERNVSPTRCLKIANLPSYATQQDIIKMYSNFSLDDVVMVQENSRSLCAYVRFFRLEDAKQAFNLPPGNLVYRDLEISICDEDKYNDMVMCYGTGSSLDMLRSSQSKRESDVSKNRQNNDSLDSGGEGPLHVIEDDSMSQEVYEVVDDDDNREDTNMSMELVSQESSDQITNNNLRRHEDPRMSRLSNLSDSLQSTFNQNSLDPRLNRNTQPQSANPNRDPRLNSGATNNKSDCVVISNLESKITDRDVVDFFSDVGLIPVRVHMLLNTKGQPSGDCFVEFPSPEDADKALNKNKTHLGQSEVTVESISRSKVDDILNSFDEPSPEFDAHDSADEVSQSSQQLGMGGGMRGGNSRIGGVGNSNNNFGMPNNHPLPLMRLPGPFQQRPMGPMGQGFNMGGGPPPPMGGMGFNPRGGPNFGMRMNGNNGSMNMNLSGRIVSMENLPYRATCEDIIDFFGDFDITPADVIRRFNEKGQTTGDARVRFPTPTEARRALETRANRKIMGRPIFLTLLDN